MKLVSVILLIQAVLFWNFSLARDESSNENVIGNENFDNLANDNLNPTSEFEKTFKSKRSNNYLKRNYQKFKPISYDGYLLDINIDKFKSTRRCNMNEVCKARYKPYFDCICPTSTLCVGHGRNFEAKCSANLLPYIWIQTGEDLSNVKPKL